MRIEKRPEAEQGAQSQSSEPESNGCPRKATLLENAILTIKILVGFAVLGAAIWGINVWKSVP